MLKKLTKHLDEREKSYFEHMKSSWKIIHTLKVIEIQCLVHSVFPFLYENALSGKLPELQRLADQTEPITDEELYEVYGGD
tara:strand:+ start:2815 stop:3057 length:243 start_codon:yes stop_codon:yes gene_type:complete